MKKTGAGTRSAGFVLDKEKLRQCRDISPQGRLQWLEEASRFLAGVRDRKVKKLWEKSRRGDV